MAKKNAVAGATEGRVKLTVEIRKIEAGETFRGVYVGKTTRPWENDEGIMQDLTTVVFRELDSDERFGVFEDAGLKLQLENALAKDGMALEIEKHEKEEMGGGRTVNKYTIYGLPVSAIKVPYRSAHSA